MLSWTLRSAVVLGLLVGLCLCKPLQASQNPPTGEPLQNQTDEEVFDDGLHFAAKQGDSEAQYQLGIAYRDGGQGVVRNDLLAVRWFYFAASQGHSHAAASLGVMYQNGLGVPQNDGEAVRLYRRGADQGSAFAQFYLGVMHYEARGVPQDYLAAYMWLSLAAAQASDEDRDFFVAERDVVAAEMTPEQIAEAQRLAREWKPTAPQ